MDERRHNMDGALFVDDERAQPQDDDRGRRTREAGSRARASARSGYDDGKADAARRITQGILDRMDLEASVHVREDDEQVVLDIDGPDAGRAIGKKGMTLEALQFLVNKIVNREPDERRHIVLDSGDYRERHDNGLVSMAKREAKRAISSGRAVTLEPMSARDRRVIHVSLAKFPGISTRSEGEGMDRRLQIIPARDRGDRDDRSTRERARDDRPRDARPREDRPRDDRGERRDERTARDDRPSDERGERRDERTARDDRPRDDRPRDDRPRDDRPRDDRPRDDRPRDDRPRDDRSRDERSERSSRDERGRDERGERPVRDERGERRDERPARERTSDRPRDDRSPPAERSRDERAASDRPRDDRAGLVERARDDRARSTRDDRARQPARDRDR